MKSRIFIGSSVESLEVAYAIQEELDHDLEPTVWSQNVFEPSSGTLEALLKSLNNYDAALFVFSPQDETDLRGTLVRSVRDNVIFEFGLFLSKLGRDRCFFLVPSGMDLHLPTDLLGITPAKYNPNRQDGNMRAAVGPACNQIRNRIKQTQIIRQELKTILNTNSSNENLSKSPVDSNEVINSFNPATIINSAPTTSRAERTVTVLVSKGVIQSGTRLHLLDLKRSGLNITSESARHATFVGGQRFKWDFDGQLYSLSTLCKIICEKFGGYVGSGAFRGPEYWAIDGENVSLAERAK